MKKVFFIFAVLVVCLIFLGIYLFYEEKETPKAPQLIEVSIEGGVIYPGIYKLKTTSTLKDLLDYAILKEEADVSNLNLHEKLKDGKTYIIKMPLSVEKININTATLEQLQQLTGIGPTLADRIINHRIKYGPFKEIGDIQQVVGIGASTYEKIRDHITV